MLSLVMLSFKMGPKLSAERLLGNPKCKKAVLCLMEKIYALDKCCSGMSYSAVSCDFSIN